MAVGDPDMPTSTASRTADSSLLGQIGNTPLIRLERSSPNPDVAIWAKLELANPSGSLKDRIALHMIERAEERGDLEPGMTIVEATSGNTGIALGMVAAVKGYKLKLFMLENKTLERRKMLRFWGADLELTTKDDPDSHIYGAQEVVASHPGEYFYINQNENDDNVGTHHSTTGPEILTALDGKLDTFVAGYGTGGMLMGVARCCRDQGVDARIVAVEPGDEPRAKIDGLKHSSESYQPPIYDRSLIDTTIEAPEDESYRETREIATREGMIAGLSSGAALWAAQQIAREMDHGNIVVIFGDRGERYFSTRLFD
jgi:cysteine synthase